MLRKMLFAIAGICVFTVASSFTNNAEAGGPFWHGGYHGRFAPAPIYRVPPRHFGYGFGHYAPIRGYHYRTPIYSHRSYFYNRGFYGPGLHYRSPGFSFRFGF